MRNLRVLFVAVTLATTAITLGLEPRIAMAGPSVQITRLKSALDTAEDRLRTGQAENARYFMKNAAAELAAATAETKADPAFAGLKARYDALEKKVASAEAKAGQSAAVEEKLRQAADALTYGKANEGSHNDRATIEFKKCVTLLDEAFAIDATARTKPNPNKPDMTNDQVRKECTKLTDGITKWEAGEGREPAAEKPQGKEGIEAYAKASAAVKQKDLDAFGLVEARKAAVHCMHMHGSLMSIVQGASSSKPYYVEDKEMLPTVDGKLTLKDFGARCKAMVAELKTRKVKGCGTMQVSLQQQLLKPSKKYGPEGVIVGTGFKAAKCDQMPSKAVTKGLGKGQLQKLQKHCPGKLVLESASWQPWEDAGGSGRAYRSISAECWAKGELDFQ